MVLKAMVMKKMETMIMGSLFKKIIKMKVHGIINRKAIESINCTKKKRIRIKTHIKINELNHFE